MTYFAYFDKSSTWETFLGLLLLIVGAFLVFQYMRRNRKPISPEEGMIGRKEIEKKVTSLGKYSEIIFYLLAFGLLVLMTYFIITGISVNVDILLLAGIMVVVVGIYFMPRKKP